MAVYGVAQVGGVLTALYPGDSMVLFDGTETPASGLKSVAFNRGPSPSSDDAGSTFYIAGIPPQMTVDVQGANADVDGQYLTLTTLSPDANGNAAYTDIGRAAYFRLKVSAYTSGAMCTAKVQR